MPIDEGILGIKTKLETNIDHAWLYNTEQDRFYTYEELKSRRELDPYPDQKSFEMIKMDKEQLYKFKKEVLDNPETYRLDYSDPHKWIPEVLDEDPNAPRVLLGEGIEIADDETAGQNSDTSDDESESSGGD